MKTRLLSAMLVVIGLSAHAFADNLITEWGGADPSTYSIRQEQRSVRILAAGTFKFEATDGAGLGDIDEITVDTGVTGDVILHIARDPAAGGGDGAVDVRVVNLAPAGYGTIAELRISADLGVSGSVSTDRITLLSVGNAIGASLTVDTLDELTCDSMQDLTITGPPTPPVYTPRIHVRGPYAGTLDIQNHSLAGNGAVDFDDIDDMVGLLGEPCSGGGRESTGDPMTPAELAAGLRATFPEEELPMLCEIVAAVRDRQRDEAGYIYWQTVLELISE